MIKLIVAKSLNNVIGNNNELVWNNKEDKNIFKELTINSSIVMGSNTFLYDLKKPLKNRNNIVLSKKLNNKDYPEIKIYSSINDLLNNEKNFWVIGGSKIYDLFLPITDYLAITYIHKVLIGNKYFPNINYQNFELINQINYSEFTFCTFNRK